MKSRLAISLSWIGGYTNVVAILATGHTVSHTTGNSTTFGKAVTEHAWRDATYLAFLIVTFLIGAMLSGLLIESSRRRGAGSKYIAPMLLEAVLLGLFAYGLHLHSHVPPDDWFDMYWMTGIAAAAMGLQNATITKIAGTVVRTTHLTGVVTDLGLELVQLLWRVRDRTRGRNLSRAGRLLRVSRRHPTVLRVALLASIFGSFLFGVITGTLLFETWPSVAMIPPVIFLLWIVAVDWFSPIADVREIDQLSDPELQAHGLIKALLPPELGIYRLWCHTRHAEHEPPNFRNWADLLPEHKQVVILALSPLTKLDSNSVMDLREAIEHLRSRRQHLILAGISQRQYRVLDDGGIGRVIHTEDICPDLEFAIARAVSLITLRQMHRVSAPFAAPVSAASTRPDLADG